MSITNENVETVEPTVKKRKRIFMWVFLAVQVLFIVWIVGGGSSANDVTAADCGGLKMKDCQAAADIGTGIGVMLIVGLWMATDFLLGVGYGIYRLAKRP